MSLKQCISCPNILEETTGFYPQTYGSGYVHQCMECCKKQSKNYKQNNKDKSNSNRREQREELFNFIDSLKEGLPCEDCKNIFLPLCMKWFNNNDASINIEKMGSELLKKDKIIKAVNDCSLYCLICFNNKNPPKSPVIKTTAHKTFFNFKNNNDCALCAKKYAPYNMVVDYKDPNNRLCEAYLLRNYGTSFINSELKKCQVLCAICNEIKHDQDTRAGKYTKVIKP